MLVVACSGEQRQDQQCRAPTHSHCSAVSEVCAGSRGVSVCGVVVLISSERLGTASLLGCPDIERTNAANCQIWSFVSFPRHDGIPFGRPSAIEAAIWSIRPP